MPIDLEELERLATQVMPVPWETKETVEYHGSFVRNALYLSVDGWTRAILFNHLAVEKKSAAYIVAACNAVPSLIERIRELERQRDFFLKALHDNGMCPNGGCFHDGSDLDEWDCTSYDNRECWITAAKEAGNV